MSKRVVHRLAMYDLTACRRPSWIKGTVSSLLWKHVTCKCCLTSDGDPEQVAEIIDKTNRKEREGTLYGQEKISPQNSVFQTHPRSL